MFRILLSTLLVLQVGNTWGWDWNWNWNKPCQYVKHINCDGGYISLDLDEYYRRDGDRDGDSGNRHGHGHDNDNDWDRHHGNGHDNDNDWGRHHGNGHDNHNDWDRHHGNGHDNDRHEHWQGKKEICGSDGITYKNRCYFRKAQCTNNILMRNEGPCAAIKSDPPKVQQTTPKAPIIDEFCKNLLSTLCHGVNPICGTNGMSYDNECEFEKAKCLDSTLHISHIGVC